MVPSKIKCLNDPRVSRRNAILNGRSYQYLYGVPDGGQYRATVVLVHGWPDLSIGWRNQIPFLLDQGLRVAAPDLMGFGGTDAPQVPPESLSLYGQKRASDDIAELARELGVSKIILGGHDWGGAVVYRCALYHPELVSHLFVVCTFYRGPASAFVPLEEMVRRAPQFGYQQHLAGPEVEATIQSKEQIRQFLHGIYGARTPTGGLFFDPSKGLLLDRLPKLGKTKLLTDDEMDYYVEEYSRHGIHGTLNWYRTSKVNFDDERSLKTDKIDVPCLYIPGLRDNVLLPAMSIGMERFIPNLTRREVNTTHWALWEDPDAVNQAVKDWLNGVVFGDKAKI